MSSKTTTKEITTKDGKVVVQETIKTVHTDRGVTTSTTTTILEGKDLTEAFKELGIDETKIMEQGGKMSTTSKSVSKVAGTKLAKKAFDTQEELDNFMKDIRDGKITELAQVEGADEVEEVKEMTSAEAERFPGNAENAEGGLFEWQGLKKHNELRKKHGAPPLKLNKKLTQYAQAYANRLAKMGKMEHSKNNAYGENLYMMSPSSAAYILNGGIPVDAWYSEIKTYTFGKEPPNLNEGHFTQVIWPDTKEMGMAMAKSKSKTIFVVAEYNPPGNFLGQFAKKVRPPKKGS